MIVAYHQIDGRLRDGTSDRHEFRVEILLAPALPISKIPEAETQLEGWGREFQGAFSDKRMRTHSQYSAVTGRMAFDGYLLEVRWWIGWKEPEFPMERIKQFFHERGVDVVEDEQ